MDLNCISKREFLKIGGGAAIGSLFSKLVFANEGEAIEFPVRQITQGPIHHWFAYYDKLQFDPTSRYCLGNAVQFEHRSPNANDWIEVGMVDLQDSDKWIPIARSNAWGWQQGCMLQWVPNSKSQVLFNDRVDDAYCSHVIDAFNGSKITLPRPIYSLSPKGTFGVTTDFRRINELRPGYGYSGIPDPYSNQRAPKHTGIERVDLKSGDTKMLVSLNDIVDIPYREGFGNGSHWFNHLLVSPNGERTIFLHRWKIDSGRWLTRMFTIGLDGSDLRELNPGAGMVSHFIWRDDETILAWTRHPSSGDAFYLIEDKIDGNIEPIGSEAMKVDGHCTYLPGNNWIVNDTYPRGPERHQEVFLYNVVDKRRVSLGSFATPPEYKGEWRCDTHPRHDSLSKFICFDSVHTGQGRQMFLVDISQLV